jgi:GT2 family glycosyltransferase
MIMQAQTVAAVAADRDEPSRPRVCVIVPHLDDLARLLVCMAALRQQTLPRSAFEIIIADNGSACGIDAVRAAAPDAHVVEAAVRGAGPARNTAAAGARGDVLAFTDSDCVPEPEWLAAGLAAIDNGADVVGGFVTLSVQNPQRPTPAECFERVFAFDNARYIAAKGFSVTANLFVRRQVFECVGPFAVGVPEDLDWCRRAQRAGFPTAYVAGAQIVHPARHSCAELEAKWDRLTREAYADFVAAGQSDAMWLMRAAAVFLSPAVHAWRVAVSPRLGSPRERVAALSVLGRIRAHRAMHMAGLCWARRTRSGDQTTSVHRFAKA